MIREFIELPAFTKSLHAGMITDEQLSQLQHDIMKRKGRIDRVQGVPGLEKMRWRNPRRRRGARGGYRVFFVDFVDLEIVVLLYLMDKKDQDDLTPDQRRQFATIIRDLRKEFAR